MKSEATTSAIGMNIVPLSSKEYAFEAKNGHREAEADVRGDDHLKHHGDNRSDNGCNASAPLHYDSPSLDSDPAPDAALVTTMTS